MKKAAVPSILVAVVLLAVAVIAEARPQAKVSKIGWLSSPSRFNQRLENLSRTAKRLRLSLFVSYVSFIGGISNKPRRLRHQSDSRRNWGIGGSGLLPSRVSPSVNKRILCSSV